MEDNMTYDAAFKELTAISKEIESESVSIDVLAQQVKRAAELIAFCQEKLRSAEGEVSKIIEGMQGA
ncbi:exodeoxyribonuclease VII small subunit [Dinghuibacter silviterrae]|uniref:Exodeoxyribonuclease VII small subunit n=1 Tax=Dinghuibacter silviterrae TaxID=1539049 RepID=A0A4R8DGU2_9BACT|nr:exodeoxyribonuclease VII small subunit [Dinghuibacter silviterrae]TDW96180.1 exodeoxyribonuclease VII small subunit [Dinghuibacter silviterrae]